MESSEDRDARIFPKLHDQIDGNSADGQQTTPRRASIHLSAPADDTASSAARSLRLKGPSLKALADAASISSNDENGAPVPATPGGLRLELQESQPTSDYVKYKILIRDGQEILVTLDKMHPSDTKLLERWLEIHRAEAKNGGLKTSANVLIVGQELHGAGTLIGPSRCHDATSVVAVAVHFN